MKTTILAAAAAALLLTTVPAAASRHPSGLHSDCNRLFPCEAIGSTRARAPRWRVEHHRRHPTHRHAAKTSRRAVSGRWRHLHVAHHGLPWCGIYMGELTGHRDRRLWVAREWAREGVNAGGPGIGVIVVWRHHVGRIEGRTADGRWVVHSGNDGHRVRTRPRSLAGAIAFRRV